ncbi:MAG: PilZ domain-containing protein [Candidatus Omnitrophota bacterium]
MKLNRQDERRSHPRVETTLPLRIKNPEFDIVTSTKNISSVGAYCQVDRYLAPLTKLDIALVLNQQNNSNNNTNSIKVRCRGVVVRTEQAIDKYNIAIFFNDIAEPEKEKINSFVKNLSSI